jgi:hypothetical protein
MFFHKKSPHTPGCLAFHIVTSVLLFLATIVSLVGLIIAHFDPKSGALVFGTMSASLSLLAFVVSLSLLLQQCKNCMSSCDVCVIPGKKK